MALGRILIPDNSEKSKRQALAIILFTINTVKLRAKRAKQMFRGWSQGSNKVGHLLATFKIPNHDSNHRINIKRCMRRGCFSIFLENLKISCVIRRRSSKKRSTCCLSSINEANKFIELHLKLNDTTILKLMLLSLHQAVTKNQIHTKHKPNTY